MSSHSPRMVAAGLALAGLACAAVASAASSARAARSAPADSSARAPADSSARARDPAEVPIPAARDSLLPWPVVEVRDARSAADRGLRLRPGFARAYDASESRGRLRMVSDLLAGAVGVRIRQFGGLGAFSAVSIRGSTPAQVAVYLDGVPLTPAQYGVVSAADFPLAALDRVEVYRGSGPLALPSPGGGVVHLVSRSDDGTWLHTAAGAGDLETRRADVAAGWRRRAASALFVGQFLASTGDFAYVDDNATFANAGDDTVRARANNDFESLALTGRVAAAAGPLRLVLLHDRLTRIQGAPGPGANPAFHARFRTDRDLTSLVAVAGAADVASPRESPPASLAHARLRFYAARQRDRFDDPARELTGLRQDNDDRTLRLGTQLDAGVPVPGGQRWTVMAEARRERYTPRVQVPAPRALPASLRRVVLVGIEDRIALAEGRVVVSAGVRREATFDDFPGGPAYPGAIPATAVARTTRLTPWAIGARADLGRGLAFKVTVARLARAPTFEELFGHRGGVHGNPGARAEVVDTRDAGWVGHWARASAAGSAWRPRWLEAQLSAYRSDARDLLVFLQTSSRSSVAQNISGARLEGVEADLRAAWPGGVTADLSWTRQWTRDQGEVAYWRGKELPGRPRDEAAARLSFARPGWRAFYELHAVGANFLDRYNRDTVPARAVHGAGVSVVMGGGAVEWTAECRNLTGRRVHDFAGYPLPGRSFFAGARLRLERKEGP